MTIRWGLCCKFSEATIKYSTTTVAYISRLKAKGLSFLDYIDQIIIKNLTALMASIEYCHAKGIGSFRITSEFLPLYTHPEYAYQLNQLPSASLIFEQLRECKARAEKYQVRLTFHPDQFVVINSPNEQVVINSIRELEYHATLAEWLGADVINIHIGGAYGNKILALERFILNFQRLSAKVKERLTIENDDKIYTVEDLLPLAAQLKIPLVYDVHHHRCLPDKLSIEKASDLAYSTWRREPLFHLSSPLNGWQHPNPRWHHDFIKLSDFPACWLKYKALTVDVEAKAKEKAIFQLIEDLHRANCG